MSERDGRRRDGERAQRRTERSWILRRESPLQTRRERRGANAEEPIPLRSEPLEEPARRLLHAPVLGEAPRELLRGLLGLELAELRRLVREETACLQLEERRDEDEELAARLEIELVALREPLDEGEHDRRDVDLAGLQLLLQEQREEEIEGSSNASSSSSSSRTGVGSTRGT